MLRFSTSKIVGTLAIVLIGLLLAVPSMLTREQRDGLKASIPGWVPSWLVPTRAIVLGLDLQGGSHVLLEVDRADLMRTQTIQLRDDVRRVLREAGVSPEGGIQTSPRGVQLRVTDPNARARLMPKLRELSQPINNAVLIHTGEQTMTLKESPYGIIKL